MSYPRGRLMNYPSGGVIRMADRVWWDGGLAVGYIARVLVDISDAVAEGLSEPSVVISTTSDCNSGAPYVVYPERLLADDGIEPLNEDDNRHVDAVLLMAAKHLGLCGGGHLGVYRKCDSGAVTGWMVIMYGGNGRSVYSLPLSLGWIRQGVMADAKGVYL